MNSQGIDFVTALQIYEPQPGALYSIEKAGQLAMAPPRAILVYCKHGLLSPATEPGSHGYYFDSEAIRTLRRSIRFHVYNRKSIAAQRRQLQMMNHRIALSAPAWRNLTRAAAKVAVALLLWAFSPADTIAAGASVPGFSGHEAEVNGTRLHYLIDGKGSPIVLLHGYAETGLMWRPIMPLLASNHTVIVPDLRGAGGSSKPVSGYDKKNMAVDIHDLVISLGFDRAGIAGHDIGLMVAYAYAAQFPANTERLILMDAFLPGIGNWENVWLLRDKWHFNFYGETPLALVKGRERIYFEHFWNDFAADSKHSVPEADRKLYAQAYARPGAMRAGFEYFHNFPQDAMDFAEFGKTPLTMPVLVLTGEKASGSFLIDQAKLVGTNVRGEVLPGSGHWLMEEAPEAVIPAICSFLNEPSPNPVRASLQGKTSRAMVRSSK